MRYKKLFIILFFISYPMFVTAQTLQIQGTIRDIYNEPIPDADVYIANTTIHTTADAQGNFILNNVYHDAPFTFIVSRVGYKTYYKNYMPKDKIDFLKIRLTSVDTLATVRIDGLKLEKWKKWKRIFIQTFIGDGEFAKQCNILNPEVLRIYFIKEDTTLKIHSVKPLRISNKALGYVVSYDILDYRFDTATTLLRFFGFPYFEQMKGKKRQIKHWEQNRKISYKGSVMQFMRAVHNNNAESEKFIMVKNNPRIIKVLNEYKMRTVLQLKQRNKPIPKDSSSFYMRIMNSPDSISKIFRDTIQTNDIRFVQNGRIYIYYNEPVRVTFFGINGTEMNKKMRPRFPAFGLAGSVFTLEDNQPMLTGKDGSYFNPEGFITQGFWAFTEKISNLLPFDFVIE